jgi:hypothetical protein
MPTISDDEAVLIMRALDHYHAHLVATKREDKAYKDLADRLQRRPPEQEVSQQNMAKKKKTGALHSRKSDGMGG